MPDPASVSTQRDAATHLLEGRRLEYPTIAGNVVEGAVSVAAGAMTGFTPRVGRGQPRERC